MKKAIAITLVLLLFYFTQAFAQNENIDTLIQNEIKRGHITGISVAVVNNGNIVFEKGYGFANIETGVQATQKTVYKIASVSKQFIAAAIMLLVQDGKLNVDDQVSKYLNNAPASWSTMTIRQLLTHSAGLPLEPPGFEPFKLQDDSVIVRNAFTIPLLFKPGERFSYSNTDYFVLANIIDHVSRMAWADFLQKHLFQPLHMTDTRTTLTSDIVQNRARGYYWKHDTLQNAEDWVGVRPSGAFLSTVGDMAKWDAALYNNGILSATSKEQMWQPVRFTDGTTLPYGFGWGLTPWMGHTRVFHDGGLPGFSADFERFIDDKITVIVLSNNQSTPAPDIALKIASFYLPSKH